MALYIHKHQFETKIDVKMVLQLFQAKFINYTAKTHLWQSLRYLNRKLIKMINVFIKISMFKLNFQFALYFVLIRKKTLSSYEVNLLKVKYSWFIFNFMVIIQLFFPLFLELNKGCTRLQIAFFARNLLIFYSRF